VNVITFISVLFVLGFVMAGVPVVGPTVLAYFDYEVPIQLRILHLFFFDIYLLIPHILTLNRSFLKNFGVLGFWGDRKSVV